ncbi:MAG: glutaredoxin domain-containing protein [bacterium]|nr:glutaredoxin domain-containing protein [bacterium]
MNNKKVEIYSTESCHFCQMTKEFFIANNVPFTNYNVGIDTIKRKEMIEKSGQMGVPVIVIDDKDIVVGFDKNKLSEFLVITN